MSSNKSKPVKIPFSFKKFLISSLGHFFIFTVFIGLLFLADSTMLAYDFLFIASGIAALMLGVYHANYIREEDIQD